MHWWLKCMRIQIGREVYNLNGVFMGKASDLKNLPKGVYIINKKKVVNN